MSPTTAASPSASSSSPWRLHGLARCCPRVVHSWNGKFRRPATSPPPTSKSPWKPTCLGLRRPYDYSGHARRAFRPLDSGAVPRVPRSIAASLGPAVPAAPGVPARHRLRRAHGRTRRRAARLDELARGVDYYERAICCGSKSRPSSTRSRTARSPLTTSATSTTAAPTTGPR